ncbi:MAG: hypothetical protein ACLS9K_10710 [Lachnospira eligens]
MTTEAVSERMTEGQKQPMDLYDGEIKKLTSMLENHGAKRLPLQRVWR